MNIHRAGRFQARVQMWAARAALGGALVLSVQAHAAAPVAEVKSAASVAAPETDELALAVNGLYPLWEGTGVVHQSGSGQASYQHAQLAWGPVQIGTQPFLDLYGTLNAQLKVALWATPRHRVAASLAAHWLPQAADARTIGDLHRSGFANPYEAVALYPLALAHSFQPSPRFGVHTTATALYTRGEATENRTLSYGLASFVEWRSDRRSAVRVHAGAHGLAVDAQMHVGLSFLASSRNLFASAGYMRVGQLSENVGRLAFDAGILFR